MHDGASTQADCTVLTGANLDHLPSFADCLFDSCVTDPPYELGFMGKAWDKSGIAYSVELWREVYRVLKPGAYLLAFGSSRGHHRMFCAIEDAGFEIRDTITWLFGSGFPKSLNVTKSMQQLISADAQCVCAPRLMQIVQDSQADYQARPRLYDEQPLAASEDDQDAFPSLADAPEHIRADQHLGDPSSLSGDTSCPETMSNTDRLSKLDSPGQTSRQSKESPTNGNRPSDRAQNTSPVLSTVEHKTEPDILGNSHLDDDSVSFSLDTVYPHIPQCSTCGKYKIPQGFGTALKPAAEYICMARKPLEKGLTVAQNVLKWGTGAINVDKCRVEFQSAADRELAHTNALGPVERSKTTKAIYEGGKQNGGFADTHSPNGRFPANVIHDGSDEVLEAFPHTASGQPCGIKAGGQGNVFGEFAGGIAVTGFGDEGSAARFFYSPKASKYDRNAGLDGVKFDGLELIVCYTCNRELQVCQEKNITNLEESVRHQKDTGVCHLKAICECGIEAKSDTALSTFLFGSESMAKFQKAIKSTIATKTNSITTSPILNLKPPFLTNESTAVANLLKVNGINPAENAEIVSTLTTFINDLTAFLHDASDALSRVQLKINVKENSSDHPTVKPTDLMQYLCRLVTPPGGLILEPFLGSGSTAKAALIERFRVVGIELNAEYAKIAEARCKQLQVKLF